MDRSLLRSCAYWLHRKAIREYHLVIVTMPRKVRHCPQVGPGAVWCSQERSQLAVWVQKREADETVEALEAPKPKRGGRKPALDAGQVLPGLCQSKW